MPAEFEVSPLDTGTIPIVEDNASVDDGKNCCCVGGRQDLVAEPVRGGGPRFILDYSALEPPC
jgi:hypothetical protein